MSVIERAEQRLQDEIRQNDLGADNGHLLAYWSAYLDGARAQKKEGGELAMSALNYVEALRLIGKEQDCNECEAGKWHRNINCCLFEDAADAIEKLQAEVKRLKECNDELREAQTYIDHYGDKWMTSAKDVPTSAYQHGYADGFDEAEQQFPKRGEWVEDTTTYAGPGLSNYKCSLCGKICGTWRRGLKPSELPNWCGNCGADMRKMEVQE